MLSFNNGINVFVRHTHMIAFVVSTGTFTAGSEMKHKLSTTLYI
jgi:hypothetical protein